MSKIDLKVGDMLVSTESDLSKVFLITNREQYALTGIFLTEAAGNRKGNNVLPEIMADLIDRGIIEHGDETIKPILIGGSTVLPGFSTRYSDDRGPKPTMIATNVGCRSSFQIHRGYSACQQLKGTGEKIVAMGELILLESDIQDKVNEGVWYSPLPITKAILDSPADQRWKKAREMIRALT